MPVSTRNPIPPSQFQALIPKPTDTLCQAIVKVFIQLPVLFYRWVKYAFNENGTPSDAFQTEICDVRKNCP